MAKEVMQQALDALKKVQRQITYHNRFAVEPHHTDAIAVLEAAIAQPAQAASPWQPIATAPHRRKLIVGYPNKRGKWRTVMACYYAEGTLPKPDEYDSEDEFADAGWYEENESPSSEVIYPCDQEPTHWMPLPSPPANTIDGSQS